MKKIISLFAAGSVAAGSAYAGLAPGDVAGDFIAGWDFAGVTGLTNDADSYGSDVGSADSSGTLFVDGTNGSSDLAPTSEAGTQVQFQAIGRGVSSTSFRGQNGFDQTTTRDTLVQTATGQTGIQFLNNGSDFSFVISLDTLVDDAVIEFDYNMDSGDFGGTFGDFLNIDYSTDNFASSNVAYAPNSGSSTVAPNSYGAQESEDSWGQATDTGLAPFLDGQDNYVIDLTGVSGINAIRFTVDANNASDSIFFDNIAVTGVPEPSAFAAIAGALALGFAATRRRRS